ncbi:MAG: MBL fold metallo-hydrolase [Clostridiales bacterium]|nr:MBL fold metallo-hydrolase [Clostridiales bacterium]
MKKTYVTTMPDHVGAFLQASRVMSELDINITRVSYNKAVDMHTLFIEVSGGVEQIAQADRRLAQIGYLQNDDGGKGVVLVEFRLRDEPGSVQKILELINAFRFNISYMSSQENGSEYQLFKMGLFVENKADIQAFLQQAESICSVRVMDYQHTEKNFDNSIFYQSYATALASCMDIRESGREELLIHVNLAMQVLDERGLSPYRTFDSISRFAELLARHRDEAFSPRISRHAITERTEIILIEPPCGSNTAIIRSGDEYLFVDTGYACYREEMLKIFRNLIPGFDSMKKRALITHADVDHCGLLPLFDEVMMSKKSSLCIQAEARGEDGFREQNPLHKPYIRICKLLTGLVPMDPEKIHVICGDEDALKAPLESVGRFSFGDLHFEVYEGKGGHLPGEIVLIDYGHKLVFTGDVYVNLKGMTAEQAAYNQYAPILMTSVDTDPALCKQEREAVMERLGVGEWQIFGAHGMKKDYAVKLQA